MAIAEATSPTAVTSTGTTVTTASFTPTANSLLLAMVSCGNTSGGLPIPGLNVTDSLSSTWTLLHTAIESVNGSGRSSVFAMDAGGSPAARTVTVTSTGGAAYVGTALCVKVITGANPVATCKGAIATVQGTTAYTVTITPTSANGSLLVASMHDIIAGGALTVNAVTTAWQSVNDSSNTEKYAAIRATALTSSTSAVTIGFTNTAGDKQCFAAVEILASAGAPVNLIPQQLRRAAPIRTSLFISSSVSGYAR